MSKEKIWSILDKNGAKYVAENIVEYAQSASGSNQNVKARCFFGWRLDANGACAPPRNECEPGLVRSEAGECVGPDESYWYK
jgi:hypothetical protein